MLTKCSAKWAEGPRATHFVSMTYEISKSRFGEPGLGGPLRRAPLFPFPRGGAATLRSSPVTSWSPRNWRAIRFRAGLDPAAITSAAEANSRTILPSASMPEGRYE